MTEDTWLAAKDPDPLLRYLSDQPPDRKMLLFAAGCYNRIPFLLLPSHQELIGKIVRVAVEESKTSDETKLAILHTMGHRPQLWNPDMGTYFIAKFTANTTARMLAFRHSPDDRQRNENEWVAERSSQADLFRHIVGNPFRPQPAPAHWPPTVVQLAEALYDGEDCTFALHDSLLDAGHTGLAKHFRREQWHPKGCWAMDLILGKG